MRNFWKRIKPYWIQSPNLALAKESLYHGAGFGALLPVVLSVVLGLLLGLSIFFGDQAEYACGSFIIKAGLMICIMMTFGAALFFSFGLFHIDLRDRRKNVRYSPWLIISLPFIPIASLVLGFILFPAVTLSIIGFLGHHLWKSIRHRKDIPTA